jgi:competence protein ComEA
VLTAWPRSAQLAFAFLLGLAMALVAVYAIGSRGSSRPTEVQGNAPLTYRVDLNKAGHAELLQLPGVGEKTAQRIENQRQAQGGFKKVDDLAKVPGIGSATIQKLRPYVRASISDEELASYSPEMIKSLNDWVRALKNEETPDENDLPEPTAHPILPPAAPGSAGKKATVDKSSKLAGPINVNRASADELRLLPGIGPTMSERIIGERARGPFKSVDDLRRVPGIGAKTLEHLRPFLTVEEAPAKGAASRPADGAE